MHPAHLRPLFGLSLGALLLMGCAEEQSTTSFKLTLVPVPPPSQADLFEDIDSLLIRVDDGAGTVDEYELAAERGTSPAIDGLSTLPEGATIELEGYRGDTLVTRGISGPLSVKAHEKVTVEIYVSALDEMATFNSLDAPSVGAAIASDGAGTFYIFGGLDTDFIEAPVDAIQRWSLLPPEASFAPTTVASFPVYSSEWAADVTARAQATATLLAEGDHDDVGKILVAGGWEGYGESQSVTRQVFLFDPSAEPDQAIEVVGDLVSERAAHAAVPLGSGDVVFFGGYTYTDQESQISCIRRIGVYNAADRTVTRGEEMLDRCLIDGAAARLGDDAIYCGGVDWGNGTYGAYGDCIQANRSGQSSVIDGPAQLGGTGLVLPSLARLGTNRVLLTGGAPILGDVDDDDPAPASTAAYIYDSTTQAWLLAASMHVARAGHASATLPDGRVQVAGGASAITYEGVLAEDMLTCAEIYDPVANEWTELEAGCGSGSSIGSLPQAVYKPSVAVDPYYGALIWGGLDREMNTFAAQPTYALFTPAP